MSGAQQDRLAYDMIPASGWSAVYVRDSKEFVWPLFAWCRPASGPLMVGLTLSPDRRVVVRADQIQGFKCYLPPAAWLVEPDGSSPPKA